MHELHRGMTWNENCAACKHLDLCWVDVTKGGLATLCIKKSSPLLVFDADVDHCLRL
jgi:hypothetical protein